MYVCFVVPGMELTNGNSPRRSEEPVKNCRRTRRCVWLQIDIGSAPNFGLSSSTREAARVSLSFWDILASENWMLTFVRGLYSLVESGKISLGDDLDHHRYPGIKLDTVRDYISQRSVEELVNGEFNVLTRHDLK